jgi:hypothetical protein
MPTVPGIPGPYRFYFYSFDCNERPHVHVQRDRAGCKLWLDPLELVWNHGFARQELTAIRRIIFEFRSQMLEAWREHCGEV